MTGEHQKFEKKSLRLLMSANSGWAELAADCVAFATATGGTIVVGIEDGSELPPDGQTIPAALLEKVPKRVREMTVNVTVEPEIHIAANGAEYLALHVPRSAAVPSTSSGKFYLREGDRNRPIVGDDVLRLATDRSTISWETLTGAHIARVNIDPSKVAAFAAAIRASDRVKPSVKVKTTEELLDHYALAYGPYLTNLGILCVGRQRDRSALGTAPVVQFIKYDAREAKLNKIVWDDFALSPIELVDAVWSAVPDFKESYELPDGLFRKLVPAYDEKVVRELLVNALVHRPYTQRGDIFLNSHPDRLEVVNPGLLPIGVTPATVLHTTVRRNEHLARIFHDLKLMDREGSGFDTMYEVLLAQGRDVPHLREGPDRVEVLVGRRILKPETIDVMSQVGHTNQLNQREMICLGLIAQHEQVSARELASALMLATVDDLRPWLGRLVDLKLVRTAGRTKATQYFVDPEVMRGANLPTTTSLGRIEPHRLEALVMEDLKRYPDSKISDIHKRIGPEIPRHKVKLTLDVLVVQGMITKQGERRGRSYALPG